MGMSETKLLREDWDVDCRLSEMELDRSKLLEVRDIAIASAANATPFHPANAAGTLAYQDGTWALREKFVGSEWKVDRSESVEAIKNDALGLKIIFSNVDIACCENQKPKPRSRKGAGSERVCSGNDLFAGMGLPEYAPIPTEEIATYYLMVDETGAAELTRPIIKGGTFSAYVEQIYLSDGGDSNSEILSFDNVDRADDFDPLVARK